jgi:tetratricopeptide (TPR) repeat protein
MPDPVRVFVSYAWESEEFKAKVKSLAARLRQDGVNARLDAWHNDGLPIPDFMDREIELADLILVVCSPAYRSKVRRMRESEQVSGVGWEQSLLTSSLWTGTRSRKDVVLVLLSGTWHESAPTFLADLPYVDLSGLSSFEARYKDVFRRLTGQTEKAPPMLLDGQPELEVLRALGYFDRPAEPAALKLLLPDMAPRKLQMALNRLRKLRLVTTKTSGEHECHPLVREYFAGKALPEWHARLYEYYSRQPPEQPDTEAAMAPLLYAIRHGCRANRHGDVFNKDYRQRLLRGNAYYLTASLGLFSTNLSILSAFFNSPWTEPADSLSGHDQSLVTSEAAYTLLALGRINDAAEPMRSAAQAGLEREDWANASVRYGHLSRLLYLLGQVKDAIEAARLAVDLADRCGDPSLQVRRRSVLAVSYHLAGDRAAAGDLFREAEQLQKMHEPDKPILYETPGYRYCDLLLAEGKTGEVRDRAVKTLAIAQESRLQLNIGLDQLLLARAGDRDHLEAAIASLRLAGRLDYLPHGLLARGTQADLTEVRNISIRCGMRLYLVDYHLAQARLDLKEGRAAKARENAAEAARLIGETGYHRRDADLAELQRAIP